MTLNNLIAMLNVSDISTSLTFYEQALGFTVVSDKDVINDWKWAMIKSGNTELMLSESNCHLLLEKGIDPHKNTSWPAIYYEAVLNSVSK